MTARDSNNFISGIVAGWMLADHMAWAILLFIGMAAVNLVLTAGTSR